MKLHLLLFYPSTWYICDFFLFHIEIEGKGGWIIGGAKGYVGPPSQIIGGAWPPLAPPLPTPMLLQAVSSEFFTLKVDSHQEGQNS